MAYRRSTRRSSRSYSAPRGRARRAPARRAYNGRRPAARRATGGRAQTVRIVLVSEPQSLARPGVPVGQKEAAPPRKAKF
jgi:hypothetical protein